MNFPFKQTLVTTDDTAEVAENFAKIIKPGDIITLTGTLGAGKTFFTREVCKAVGIENVSSPSFAIVNEYYGKLKVHHFDFYRLNSEDELYDIGLDEYLSDDDSVKFIEWAELYKNLLKKIDYEVIFNLVNADVREITITSNTRN